MCVSSIVPEKSRENKKKCDEEKEEEEEEEEELRHIFWQFWHHCKMAVTWLYATLLISINVHTVEDSMLLSIFGQFCFSFVFWGCQNRP